MASKDASEKYAIFTSEYEINQKYVKERKFVWNCSTQEKSVSWQLKIFKGILVEMEAFANKESMFMVK